MTIIMTCSAFRLINSILLKTELSKTHRANITADVKAIYMETRKGT